MNRHQRNLLLAIVSMGASAAFVWWLGRPKHAATVDKPQVAIQDGKTIDFSSGRPVVKDSKEERAIIDAAVKEMDEAARNVTFGPTAAKTAGSTTKSAGGASTPPTPK